MTEIKTLKNLKKINFQIKLHQKYIRNMSSLDEINGDFIEELKDKKR